MAEDKTEEERALLATEWTAGRVGMKVAGQSHEEMLRTIHEALAGAFLAGLRSRTTGAPS